MCLESDLTAVRDELDGFVEQALELLVEGGGGGHQPQAMVGIAQLRLSLLDAENICRAAGYARDRTS